MPARQRFTKTRRTIDLLGWPTDVVSVDPNDDDGDLSEVHTLLVWIPGNPGQHDWYDSDMESVLSGLGKGYAARSVSHAGHGLATGATGTATVTNVEEHCAKHAIGPFVPWTVDGQVFHKIAYLDHLLATESLPSSSPSSTTVKRRLIWIGHSFGCHVIQQFCVLRPDLLELTAGCLFLMPYIRTKPAFGTEQRILDWGGSFPERLISVGTTVSRLLGVLPDTTVRKLVEKAVVHGGNNNNNNTRQEKKIVGITQRILTDPWFPRNHFELGTEEIRDIPNEPNVSGLRFLLQRKRKRNVVVCILYAGDHDQWCPSFHEWELRAALGSSSNLLETTKLEGLRHDYVCQDPGVTQQVYAWCVSRITKIVMARDRPANNGPMLSSKL